MPRNLKFHALVIASITLGVFAVFHFSGRLAPPAAAPLPEAKVISAYQISIHEASWGLNCLESMSNTVKSLQAQRNRTTDASEIEEIQTELDAILPLPERNNATQILADLCNEKESCELSFTENSIPLQPTTKCRYKLDILYLCSRFDEIRFLQMKYGDQETIDCTNTEKVE